MSRGGDTNTTTSSISNSRLLRLPEELQELVWKHVFGDRVIHVRWIIDEDYARLIGLRNVSKIVCSPSTTRYIRQKTGASPWRLTVCSSYDPENSEPESHETCHDDLKRFYTEIRGTAYRRTVDARRYDIIPWDLLTGERPQTALLTVCRSIYRVAIDVWATTNTFSFNDPLTFQKWMTAVSVHHREEVRCLHLDMDEWRNWNRVFPIRSVKLLRGLRRLRLRIAHMPRANDVRRALEGRHTRDPWRALKNVNKVLNFATLPLEEVEVRTHSFDDGDEASGVSWEVVHQHLSIDLGRAFLC